MKKYLFTILLGAFGAMAIAAPALAATSVSFTPVNVSVRQGQTFTLTIGVNPQGAKNYTAKTELRYPADLLEVKSFTFANGWTPLSQSGYDLTDNTNGVFIKTAGYPGGVSSPVTFGTVSFLAKKSGNGTIALNSNSFVLDANNQNVLAGASVQTAVAISAPAPVQTTPITPTTPAGEPIEEAAGEEAAGEELAVEEELFEKPELVEVGIEEPTGLGKFLAAIGAFPFSPKVILIILALILIGLFILWLIKKKKERK